ncbi:MAG TPA: GTPase, partial [Pirellulales bacterium]|nr:GTPase [Pirellulales bacterium]
MYKAWVSRVARLAQALRDLEPTAKRMRLPPPESFDWHGNLFQKLLPQLEIEPFLIVAVTGGTNTGKSVIFNHLAGSRLSRTHPNATQTKHPVCSVPQGFLTRHDLTKVFPDFELREWVSQDDALAEGPDNRLFVRTDPAGTQPARLLLFDTPDVDGTLRDNWRRAELVRHAADVLVCILTQQKYNDAAVREFFASAAAVDKTVVVIFNMVDWPRQRELIGGWLATFSEQTGVDPVHVYAAPWDPDAAEANLLPFHPITAGATNPRDDLAELHFDDIKIRSFRGSLRGVLDVQYGVPSYLALVEQRAGEYREARDVLFHRMRLEIKDLPQLPKRLVWDEIWHWLERRRTRFDRAINGVYTAVGSVFSRWLGKDPQTELAHFQEQEWDKLRLAMAAFLDLIDTLRRGGNEILRDVLDRTPAAL